MRVLAEVVAEVAALPEDTVASIEVALEELLDSLRGRVMDFDSLVPLARVIQSSRVLAFKRFF